MSLLILPNLLVNNTPGDANPVQANFVAIAAIINGSLDQANFAAGAGLSTRLIALDGGLVESHFALHAVTAAKIAPGGTIRGRVQGTVQPNLSIGTTETALGETTPLVTSGGRVLVSGVWGAVWQGPLSTTGVVTVRILRVVAGVLTEVTRVDYQAQVAGGGIPQVPLPFPVAFDTPGVTTCSYRVTATASSGLTVTTGSANAGVIVAEEAT